MNGKGRLNNKTKYSYMFGDLGVLPDELHAY